MLAPILLVLASLASLAAGSLVELVPGRVAMEWRVDREREEVTITVEASGLGERCSSLKT